MRTTHEGKSGVIFGCSCWLQILRELRKGCRLRAEHINKLFLLTCGHQSCPHVMKQTHPRAIRKTRIPQSLTLA